MRRCTLQFLIPSFQGFKSSSQPLIAVRTISRDVGTVEEQPQASSTPNTSSDVPPRGERLLDMFSPSMGSSIPSSSSSSSHATSEPPSTKQGRRQQAASSSSQEGPDRDVVQIMLKAVANVAPMMKVQTIRAGTRVVHVPKVVMPGEQRSLAVRWVCCPALQLGTPWLRLLPWVPDSDDSQQVTILADWPVWIPHQIWRLKF